MVSPREPKIAQNRQKSCSRGLPESIRQKVTKNDAIWEGWICNSHTPVQSKHTFSFSRFGQKSDPKSFPKWSLGAPQITKNQEKWALKKTLKNASKKNQKIPQKGTSFSWRKCLQNHKNPSLGSEIFKMGPQASKITPWASQITKNHDSDFPKSRIFYCKLLAFCTLVVKTSWRYFFKRSVANMNVEAQSTDRYKKEKCHKKAKKWHGGGLCAQRIGYFLCILHNDVPILPQPSFLFLQ